MVPIGDEIRFVLLKVRASTKQQHSVFFNFCFVAIRKKEGASQKSRIFIRIMASRSASLSGREADDMLCWYKIENMNIWLIALT